LLLLDEVLAGGGAAAFLPFDCCGWSDRTAEGKVDAEAVVCLCWVRDMAAILPLVVILPELMVGALEAVVTKTLAPGLGRYSSSQSVLSIITSHSTSPPQPPVMPSKFPSGAVPTPLKMDKCGVESCL
jgi:hypothetical protein